MSKLVKHREEVGVLAKRMSKCFIMRETNAIVDGDKVMAETLATEIREIVDKILKAQDQLPNALDNPDMMREVIELLINKRTNNHV